MARRCTGCPRRRASSSPPTDSSSSPATTATDCSGWSEAGGADAPGARQDEAALAGVHPVFECVGGGPEGEVGPGDLRRREGAHLHRLRAALPALARGGGLEHDGDRTARGARVHAEQARDLHVEPCLLARLADRSLLERL